jgi:hypothetical protein
LVGVFKRWSALATGAVARDLVLSKSMTIHALLVHGWMVALGNTRTFRHRKESERSNIDAFLACVDKISALSSRRSQSNKDRNE